MKKTIHISGLVCTTLVGFACAGTPKPTDQLVRAEAALRAAEEVGAGNVPQAQLHHTLAEEQLEKARRLIEDDEHARAQSSLERAKADAELALALAREHEAKRSAEDAETALQATTTNSTSAMHEHGANTN